MPPRTVNYEEFCRFLKRKGLLVVNAPGGGDHRKVINPQNNRRTTINPLGRTKEISAAALSALLRRLELPHDFYDDLK